MVYGTLLGRYPEYLGRRTQAAQIATEPIEVPPE
jgi:hypothetical protein